jgi:hypothetical protein
VTDLEQLIEIAVRRAIDGRLDSDPPKHITPELIAARCGIKERTAGEWIRQMIAEGVLKKHGRFPMGRLSAVDAWIAGELDAGKKRRRVTLSARSGRSDNGGQP